MKLAFRIFAFLVLVVVSILALLLLLPFLKEGASQSEVPALIGGVGLFLLLGLVWWLVCGRSLKPSVFGWLVLALPTVAYLAQAGQLVAANLEGLRLAKAVRIENYQEKTITWPGFDGPIGLTIAFELVHPDGVSALILPPEVRMAPVFDIPRNKLDFSQTSGSGYFKDYYLEEPVGDLTLLKSVLFQRHYRNETFERDYEQWVSSFRFQSGTRTPLVFHLHPGTIDQLDEPGRLCLSSHAFGHRVCAEGEDPTAGCTSPNRRLVTDPIYAQGSDLTALWVAAGAYDMVADLGPTLTATLRAESRLQGDPEGWTAMQKRLEPTGLKDAGYRLCPPGETSHTASRTCYCKAGLN